MRPTVCRRRRKILHLLAERGSDIAHRRTCHSPAVPIPALVSSIASPIREVARPLCRLIHAAYAFDRRGTLDDALHCRLRNLLEAAAAIGIDARDFIDAANGLVGRLV